MTLRCKHCGTAKGTPHRYSCRTRSNPASYLPRTIYVDGTSSTGSSSDSGSSSGSSCDSGSSGSSSDGGGGGGCE